MVSAIKKALQMKCFQTIYKVISNAEGFGKRFVSKFAKANSSHKWLSAFLGGTKFSDWNPQ